MHTPESVDYFLAQVPPCHAARKRSMILHIRRFCLSHRAWIDPRIFCRMRTIPLCHVVYLHTRVLFSFNRERFQWNRYIPTVMSVSNVLLVRTWGSPCILLKYLSVDSKRMMHFSTITWPTLVLRHAMFCKTFIPFESYGLASVATSAAVSSLEYTRTSSSIP